MISRLWRGAISRPIWTCWALGPLGLVGAVLAYEDASETRGALRERARVIDHAPIGERQPGPLEVSLLNPSAHPSPVQDDEPPAEIADSLPNKGVRVRASNAVRFRTWCVRLCDGYYYPMNYLTTRGRLEADEEKCRASCSSEMRLYVNSVAGYKASPLADLSGQPYTDLPTAFAYRAALHRDCTCEGLRMLVTNSTVPPGLIYERGEDEDPWTDTEAGR